MNWDFVSIDTFICNKQTRSVDGDSQVLERQNLLETKWHLLCFVNQHQRHPCGLRSVWLMVSTPAEGSCGLQRKHSFSLVLNISLFPHFFLASQCFSSKTQEEMHIFSNSKPVCLLFRHWTTGSHFYWQPCCYVFFSVVIICICASELTTTVYLFKYIVRRGLRLKGKRLCDPAEADEEEDKKDEEEEENKEEGMKNEGEGEGQVDTDDCVVCPGNEAPRFVWTVNKVLEQQDEVVIEVKLIYVSKCWQQRPNWVTMTTTGRKIWQMTRTPDQRWV